MCRVSATRYAFSPTSNTSNIVLAEITVHLNRRLDPIDAGLDSLLLLITYFSKVFLAVIFGVTSFKSHRNVAGVFGMYGVMNSASD